MSIKVKNISKTYKVVRRNPGILASIKSFIKPEFHMIEAVRNLSFIIEQGELVGFLGANGAGKTTTLKMLTGLVYPTDGEIEVLGFEPAKRNHNYLKQISLVMGQKNQLWWDLPAEESFNLNKQIYEIDRKEYEDLLNELLELLDMKEVVSQPVRKLSLGQRMKAELIASLLHKPRILFLDEPTIGLDIVMQKKIREFIKDYNKRFNATIMLTSHYMEDVSEICDRIILISKGEKIYDGSIEKLIKDQAGYKILVPVFMDRIERAELEKYGEVIRFDGYRAEIKVARSQSSEIAVKLHQKYELDDLDINEPDLEAIVEQLI